MADGSNLKINERWNVERPNLRVSKIENKNWKDKGLKLIYIKGKIWESTTMRVVPNTAWTNNFKICQFLEFWKFWKLWTFLSFPNCKILEIR